MKTNEILSPLTNTNPARTGMSINLRPYNLKELSYLYGISAKTFKNWIKPFEEMIGKRRGYYFTIPQVRKIFKLLEFPSVVFEEDGV